MNAVQNATQNVSREETRALILQAGAALLRKSGVDAVTLGAVAREADMARGAVYGLFSSRKELLAELGVVLEEKSEPVAAPSGATVAGTVREPASELASEPFEPDDEFVQVCEPVSVEQPAGEDPAPVENEYDALARAQAEALTQLTKQVIVPKPRQRDAMEAALTRVEARLTVTEKNMAALEQRVGDRLKGLDVDTGAVSERLHALRQRLEKFEERQTTALAQLRLDVHYLLHPSTAKAPEGVEPKPVAMILPEPADEVETDPDEHAKKTAADQPRAPSYLHTARQAAITASQIVATMPARQRTPLQRFWVRKRWLILAAASVMIFWFDAYVFANYTPARGAVDQTVVTRPQLSPRAQLMRGLTYLNGTGTAVNLAKATVLIARSARRGDAVAANMMGTFYQSGTGVPANMATAVGWYETAAAKGNLKAMTNLGKLYAGGWEQGTDFAKAATWFARAAAYGEVDAAFDLAILYERGAGVTRNPAAAYKWYVVASALGDTHGRARADFLKTRISPEERQAAEAEVAAFKPATLDPAANDLPVVSAAAR